MNRFTRNLAMASARNPWRTFASWVLALVAVVLLASSFGGTFTDDFSAPGSQSARAMELLNENFPDAAQGRALVVFEGEDGTTLHDHREQVAAVVADVSELDHVATVADPFAAGTVSQDGRIELNIGGNSVDIRVSTLPTLFGESVVLRILDRTVVQLDAVPVAKPLA